MGAMAGAALGLVLGTALTAWVRAGLVPPTYSRLAVGCVVWALNDRSWRAEQLHGALPHFYLAESLAVIDTVGLTHHRLYQRGEPQAPGIDGIARWWQTAPTAHIGRPPLAQRVVA